MKIQKMSVGAIILALMLTSATAFAGPPGGMHSHHGMPPMMGWGGIAADNQHLYVLAGPKIMQFSLADVKLLKTVDLPKPTPPTEKTGMPCQPPGPPRGGGPHGICTAGGSLYVLAGPTVYRFKTPELALETSVQLPKPEMPKREPPKAGN